MTIVGRIWKIVQKVGKEAVFSGRFHFHEIKIDSRIYAGYCMVSILYILFSNFSNFTSVAIYYLQVIDTNDLKKKLGTPSCG